MSELCSVWKNAIASEDVVLFMKGIPAAPQCGFSAAVVQILSSSAFRSEGVDVLADGEIREGVKAFPIGRRSHKSM